MVDLDRRLALVAARQHSLITHGDVIAAGGADFHINERLASGRWERVDHCVYRIAGVPWTWEARVMARVLAAGPSAVASYFCAGRLWGLGRCAKATPEISIPHGRRYRRKGVRVHESTDLDRCEIVLRSGIPVPDAARVLLDLARYLGPNALLYVIEDARRQGLVTWTDLLRCLAIHARQGRHGITRLREVVTGGMHVDEVTDTDTELLALLLIREHGLREPVLHHHIYDEDDVLIAEPDLAYPDLMLGYEIDGGVHLRPEVAKRDKLRDAHLRRRGWEITRFWWTLLAETPVSYRGTSLTVDVARHP